MAVWALGINHTTAPLDLRGRFAFALDQIAPTLHGLRQSLGTTSRHPGVETAIISTCNRTEIYCAGEQAAMDHTLGWLAQSGGVSPALLRSHSYTLEDSLVARHAFRVASGLDSMVLGEAQILGQMKDAVRAAETAGALGTTLNQLFQRSFAVAKEVRTTTEIGATSREIAATSRDLVRTMTEVTSAADQASILAGLLVDSTSICAALLHDVVEDQGGLPRADDVRARFGDRVADIVLGCSDSTAEHRRDKLPYVERKAAHIAHLREASDDVLLVTAADKLHNARAIHTDLMIDGPGMLARFNGEPDQILAYYRSILDVLESRGIAPVLVVPLRHVVDQMAELMPTPGEGA